MGDTELTIVMACGKTFVGELVTVGLSDLAIRDALELQSGMVQTREGTGIVTQAMPVLMLPSLTTMAVPPGAIMVALRDVDREDRRQVTGAYLQGLKMRDAIKAARSGVAVAPASALIGIGPVNGGPRR